MNGVVHQYMDSPRLLAAAAAAATISAVLWLRSRSLKYKGVRLTYLDTKGAGEPIRLALFIAGVPFEDIRVTYSQIAQLRESGYLPFGQVPVLEVDGKVFGQSQAILRWVGRMTGLYPERLQLRVDQVDEAIVDLKYILRPAWYGAALGRSPINGEPLLPLSADQRAATLETLDHVILPARLAQLERLLAHTSDGPFVCGSELTIADLNLYVYATGILAGDGVPAGISNTLLDDCPRILALVQHVEALPRVQEWNKRPTTPAAQDSPSGNPKLKTVNAF